MTTLTVYQKEILLLEKRKEIAVKEIRKKLMDKEGINLLDVDTRAFSKREKMLFLKKLKVLEFNMHRKKTEINDLIFLFNNLTSAIEKEERALKKTHDLKSLFKDDLTEFFSDIKKVKEKKADVSKEM